MNANYAAGYLSGIEVAAAVVESHIAFPDRPHGDQLDRALMSLAKEIRTLHLPGAAEEPAEAKGVPAMIKSPPERLWLGPMDDDPADVVWAENDRFNPGVGTEYVRADLYQTLMAELLKETDHTARLGFRLNQCAHERNRLRSMIAGWANGHVPDMQALQREADAIRAAMESKP